MGPRPATVVTVLTKAIKQIKDEHYQRALNTISGILERIGEVPSAHKKPNKYALYVQTKFPKYQAKFPNMSNVDIMKMIAEEWQKSKLVDGEIKHASQRSHK